MAEQQEMFEYSPPPDQAQFSNDRTSVRPEEGQEPIKIELDAGEEYQIGNQVVSGEDLIAGKVHGNIGVDDSRWADVSTLREEVARLQGQLSSVEQGRVEQEPSLQESSARPNRIGEVFNAALEENRSIDHELLADLFTAFAADRDETRSMERQSPESVSATKEILDQQLTMYGQEQIAQQSKHKAASDVFDEFIDNKSSSTGATKDSISEDYQDIADEVLNDPSLLTMKTAEEAGSFMLNRLKSIDRIIEKHTGGNGAVQRTEQQSQAQLNSGNGKVYTPRRTNDQIEMPVYPSEEKSRFNFNQRVKQGSRVIG